IFPVRHARLVTDQPPALQAKTDARRALCSQAINSRRGWMWTHSDMTYTLSLTESFSETVSVPMSCLSTGGVTVTCDELTMALGGLLESDGGTMTNCTASGSGCDCNISLSGMTTNDMGTYTVSGNTLTTTSSTSPGTTGGGDYCVQGGNTLHLISIQMGTGGAAGTPAADLVATKE
ncbi:MAG: hypothetical protein ACLP1X_11700, partial [Polyangiaceae bacterium]